MSFVWGHPYSQKQRMLHLLFRWMHKMLTIHHLALLLFKNYLTIQVGTLQRIHHQYNRYESALDDILMGIESLSSGYLTHCILDPKTLSRYLEAIADDMEDTAPDYEPISATYIYKIESSGIHVTLQCGDSTHTIRCRNLHRCKTRVHSNSAQN